MCSSLYLDYPPQGSEKEGCHRFFVRFLGILIVHVGSYSTTEIGVSELNSKWFWLDIPVFIWVISEKEAMPLSAFKLTCFLLGAPIFISFLTGIETFHI